MGGGGASRLALVWTLVIAGFLFAVSPAVADENVDREVLYFSDIHQDGNDAVITLTNALDIEDLATIKCYDADGRLIDVIIRTIGAEETLAIPTNTLPQDAYSVIVEFNGRLSGELNSLSGRKGRREAVTDNSAKLELLSPSRTRCENSYAYGEYSSKSYGQHTGQDYGCGQQDDPIKSVGYGVVRYIYRMPKEGYCATSCCEGRPDHGMGNVIEVEHLLTTGEKIYASYNHLNSFPSNYSSAPETGKVSSSDPENLYKYRVAKKQLVG
ncbi:MAG: M23 family metallopeptidase, partial [Desulfobacteraceae bacterium]|nr:M23 family metallopeptidase [Desulfobacteraceae bacterium]